jgi:hypothetical protein
VLQQVQRDGLVVVAVAAFVPVGEALVVHRVEHRVPSARERPHHLEQPRDRHTAPFGDRVPALDAVVVDDLAHGAERAELVQ